MPPIDVRRKRDSVHHVGRFCCSFSSSSSSKVLEVVDVDVDVGEEEDVELK